MNLSEFLNEAQLQAIEEAIAEVIQQLTTDRDYAAIGKLSDWAEHQLRGKCVEPVRTNTRPEAFKHSIAKLISDYCLSNPMEWRNRELSAKCDIYPVTIKLIEDAGLYLDPENKSHRGRISDALKMCHYLSICPGKPQTYRLRLPEPPNELNGNRSHPSLAIA
jgi:hypothetical protein